MKRRIFTLREAQALLPTVQELTRVAVQRVEQLQHEIGHVPVPRRHEVETACNTVVEQWAESIWALGIDVKGLWLVDFDSGDGLYYCWRHPEAEIEYFHDYDSGFTGRRPLGALNAH